MTAQAGSSVFVDIRDFGAIAGGAALGNTSAIQAALDASRAVVIPPGIYDVDDTLVPQADSILCGIGKTASYLRLAPQSGLRGIYAPGRSRVNLADFGILLHDGQVGIEYAGSQENPPEGLSLTSLSGHGGTGILVRSYQGTGSYSHSYRACDFQNVGVAVHLGVASDANPGANVIDFLSCKWSGCQVGIHAGYATAINLFGGRLEGCGIGIEGRYGQLSGLRVYGTYFESNGWHYRLGPNASECKFDGATYVGGRCEMGQNATNLQVGTFCNEQGPVPGYVYRGPAGWAKGNGEIHGVLT